MCGLVVATVVPAESAAPSGAAPCTDACTCAGREDAPKTVPASSIVDCISKGRPVTLAYVRVIGGDVKLSALPSTRLPAGSTVRLAGLPEPRAHLGLDALEREQGRLVPGAIVVREALTITNSVIHGAIVGPVPTKGQARSFCPLAFLQTVDLRGTTVKGATHLPFSRFRLPLIATNSVFEGRAVFLGAVFADNALFGNATFHRPMIFRDAVFERRAVFGGVELNDPATAAFDRAVFRQGAWFQTEGRTTRLRNADFSEAEVAGGEANFQAAAFDGVAKFTKARLQAGVRFIEAHFSDLAEFDETAVGGPALFNGAIFAAGGDFSRSTFEAKPFASFDRAEFKTAAFDGVRFGGPADFLGARFGTATFLDVDFTAGVDFRGASFQSAEFGGARAKTSFGGVSAFDFATARRANFENAHFWGRTSFAGAVFGGGPPCRPEPMVVNFFGAVFGDAANFGRAVFHGRLNWSHVVADPARTALRWHQVVGRLVSESVAFTPDPACGNRKEFSLVPGRSPTPRTEVLRWLERSLRAQEWNDDAREAFAQWKDEETWGRVTSSEATGWTRTVALASALLYGLTSGYGVFPARVLATAGLALVGFWTVYMMVSGRPLRRRYDSDSLVQFKVTRLPWRAEDTLVPPRESEAQLALWVSLAALASIHVKGAYVLTDPGDRFWWVLATERACGYYLLVLLAESLATTVPVVAKLLGWLL